jgi:beta-lactamase class D
MIQHLVACSVFVGAVTVAQGFSPASCFLLYEIGVGQVRRNPASACSTRLSPASTFKIPHALAALDAGVVSGPDETFTWDGTPRAYESWRRDHTLASAMRYSVLWIFVSAVTGADDLPALAAVDLAAKSLREEGVLPWELWER